MAPGTHRLRAIAAALVTALLLVLSGREPLSAQAGSAQAGSPAAGATQPFLAVGAATPAPESDTLTFVNRPIEIGRASCRERV